MNARPLIVAAAVAAALASPFVLAQKPTDSGPQFSSSAPRGGDNPDGTPTLTVNVPVGGAQSINACDFAAVTAGNFTIPINLGANAVITGLGGTGTINAPAPSFLSEAAVQVRGAVVAEVIRFRPLSTNAAPGVAPYNVPVIDLSGATLPNITGGPSGNFILEFCETFDDGPGADATWVAPSFISLACFSCFDPFAARISVPSTSTWSLIALLLALGVAGGVAVRRFS